MKILVIDDSQDRMEIFVKCFSSSEHEISYAKCYDESIVALDSNVFNVVFLDHDLGEDKTGHDIAKHILEKGQTPIVVIHSMNVPAATNVQKMLIGSAYPSNVVVVPFGSMMFYSIMQQIIQL